MFRNVASMIFESFDSALQIEPKVDLSITHAVPGLNRPVDYQPLQEDPLYIGEPLPNALLEDSIEHGTASKAL